MNYMLHQHSEGFLAPYALKSKNSKGRKYPESTHPVRTYYQRDTARIVHSRPFRRLEYKTQVFLNGTGDHYRTRLTHTMEVSITARTIARTLNLNEDLTEAISLAHDLGHTPFGHIGEYALNAALEPYERGFEHNLHSLRIVDELTLKYPNFQGLNLSWETRLGLLKHRNPGQTLDNIEIPLNLSLEGQVADIADDLTYYAHDIDDGITSRLISVNMLDELEIWQQIREIISKDGVSENSERFVAYALRALINLMATDVLENSSQNIKKYNINTPEQPQNIQESLIVFSPHMEKNNKRTKIFSLC